MKLSITYLYTIFRYGYPPKPADDFKALADIEKMGFRIMDTWQEWQLTLPSPPG